MDAHGIARQAQRARQLVGILGHLDRGPDVEQLIGFVPLSEHAEGLDRHRRTAAPGDPERHPLLGFAKSRLDRAPDELAVIQLVAAVFGMDQRRIIAQRQFGIDDMRRGLVFDLDQFGGILGLGAAVGDHRHHPLA